MEDWKELEIDNLPPDILTGDYEFKMVDRRIVYDLTRSSGYNVISRLENGQKTLYRKRQPKAPNDETMAARALSRVSGMSVFRARSIIDHVIGEYKQEECQN